jgi:hypothetical protein
MRVFWIVLLMALLPLRGWVGDAMAVGMATPSPVQSASAAAPGEDCPHHAPEADTGDAGHGGPGGHALVNSDAPDHGEHGDAQQHLLCDVCNGPVLGATGPGTQALAIEQGPPVEHAEGFASLAPRQIVKPPIA